MLQRLLLIALTSLILIPRAFSYEKDTHLRMTYILARAAGINDEVSKYLAYGDQNIDQHFITSAMFLSSQRGLFHFTGTRTSPRDGGHGNASYISTLLDRIFKNKLALAERNHPVGSMLIYQGLTRGDLQLVAAGLHVKQDTYGHAGFTSAFGHMFDGHNPDRAFLETEKYEDMIRALLRSLVAIRKALPPEYTDMPGALKFLNEYALQSHLKRQLTAQDMNDAVVVSGVFNSIVDIKKIFFENMFTNYHYKKLALRLVFSSWSAAGVINKDMTFDELFPEKLLRNPRMDTSDTLKAVIVSDLESDFLKTSTKDILNTQVLFKSRNIADFLAKVRLEEREYAVRLRELTSKQRIVAQMEALATLNAKQKSDLEILRSWIQKESIELSFGSNLENLSAQLENAKHEAMVARSIDLTASERQIFENYQLKLAPLQKQIQGLTLSGEISDSAAQEFMRLSSLVVELDQKMQLELDTLRSDVVAEAYIKVRARQLAEYKAATEISDRLTKDFIPRHLNQYIKQQFEGQNENRDFEVDRKDELYRRFIVEKFGSNWVSIAPANPLRFFAQIAGVFRTKAQRAAKLAQEQLNELIARSVQESADEMIENKSPRENAQGIKFNRLNNSLWIIKMLRYAGPCFIPFVSSRYLNSLYAKAEVFAKAHEVEDMTKALEEGKYRQLITDQRPAIKEQIKAFRAPPLCSKMHR